LRGKYGHPPGEKGPVFLSILVTDFSSPMSPLLAF